MLGMLIVLVIIMIMIVYFGPLSKNEVTKVTQAQGYIGRARDVSCLVDRGSIQTRIQEMQIENQGAVITPRILEKKGYLTPCPAGWAFTPSSMARFIARSIFRRLARPRRPRSPRGVAAPAQAH